MSYSDTSVRTGDDKLARVVRDRRFAMADLGLATVGAVLWFATGGQVGWWPLLIALLPWAVRLAARNFPVRRTALDFPLVLFLLAAAVGVWAAHDRAAAEGKFWLIVSAILLFYALAGQPQENLWLVVGALIVVGLFGAGFFLFTHDWLSQPAKFEPLNQIAAKWMELRPTIKVGSLHPNVAGSLLAILAPFLLAAGLSALRQRRPALLLGGCLAGAVIGIGLLMTSSRGAWLALGTALGAWALWTACSRLGRTGLVRAEAALCLALGAIAVVGLAFAWSYPGGLEAIVDLLPGPASGSGRLGLQRDTLRLIGDYLVTGGGLNSFPGLYSQYILVIPFYFLPNSHNIFLDAALEQGLLGSIALAVALLVSLWLLASWPKRDSRRGTRTTAPGMPLIRWAAAASLVVMVLHGLVEDTVYGSSLMPLLLVPSGVIVASVGKDTGSFVGHLWNDSTVRAAAAVTVTVAAALLVAFRRQATASIFASVGAIQMARVELVGWPSGQWDDGGNSLALLPAEAYFQRALALDSANRTAHHRLGLIAMIRRDFATALEHLEMAYLLDDQHRGIRKTLGYSYVWAGKPEHATVLLQEIPEARDEMKVYAWWWNTLGHDALAAQAAQMARSLGAAGT